MRWWNVFGAFVVCAVVLAGVPDSSAAPGLWEFTPEPIDAIPIGRTQVVGAELPDGGTRFIVKNLTVDMPLQLTLSSGDAANDLTLEVFKETWDAPILSGTTGIAGALTFRFRTGDHAAMQVRGPAGAEYQLMAWVGPEMKPVPVPPLVSPEEYTRRTGRPTVYESEAPAPAAPERRTAISATDSATVALPVPVPVPPAPPPPPPPSAPAEVSGLTPVIVGLLTAILVVLVVIVVLLMRRRGPPPAAAFLVAALLLLPSTAGAQDGTVPGKKSPEEWHDQISQAMHKLRETLSGFSGNDPFNPNDKFTKGVDELAKATGALIGFMEHFGLIDPREAAVRPDYNPSDAPPLPARGFSDPFAKARSCLREGAVAEDLQKWQTLLEDLRVIYKQTMLEAGRIIEMADAAAGMSSIAKLKWTIDKGNPNEAFNKSQAAFYATYDDAYTKLMDKLNRTLLEIAECEKSVYGIQRWYELYGLPYYLYMRDRYKRSG